MRRSLFLLLIIGLLAFAWYRYDHFGAGNGRRLPEKYTPASGPRINLKDVEVLSALDAEYSRLVDAVVPSVVSINSRSLARPRYIDPLELFRRRGAPQQRVQSSLGSGVIVSKEGHVLTNHHVVEGMAEIQVQLTDGRTVPAQLIGSDEQTDIAVLKINADKIEPLPLGDSDEVRVGQMVFAVGNPFGLQETVTQGIISAKGRRAMRDSGVEFLQTDAAVNQGNSGGPLLNLRGEIIGINSAIYSETGGWLGISFAIPSNVARRALESLIKTGRVIRGYLGIFMENVTPELARELGLPDPAGALVTDVVAGSPAQAAGLQSGDVVREINGRAVKDIMALRSRIADVDLGASVEITYFRAGEERKASAQVAEAPDVIASAAPQVAPKPGDQRPPRNRSAAKTNVLTGVQVSEIPTVMRDFLPENAGGVLVAQVQPGSIAGQTLQPGDIIEEINERAIESVEDFEKVAQSLAPDAKALLYIIRGRSRSFVVLTP
ncbi:MAG TPA: Do family serine endopeptidase [Chthoniobacteraceae bacterium]